MCTCEAFKKKLEETYPSGIESRVGRGGLGRVRGCMFEVK